MAGSVDGNGRVPRRRSVAVVGGGFGGVGAAVMLARAGYRDVTVFERGERVGGVWHHNTYPGAAALSSSIQETSLCSVIAIKPSCCSIARCT